MTEALESMGTALKRGDGLSPETFTQIANVGDISGPDITLETDEITNHSSPGHYEEVVASILRSGEVTFPINWLPSEATHKLLISDRDNRTKRNFQMVLTDAASTTWSFAAYVVKFTMKAPVKGHLTADLALKITGQPTLS